MKQKLSNFLFGLLCIAGQIVHAQDNNGCNMTWSNPARAIYNSEGTIYYVVQFSKCSSSSICGWPKIALEHTFPFPVSISLTLSGIQCDGTAIKGDYSTASNEISPNNRYINQGNWHTFKSVTEVVRVEVSYHKGSDFYKIVYDKEKGINETYINNKTIVEYNVSKQQSNNSGSSSNNKTETVPNNNNRTNKVLSSSNKPLNIEPNNKSQKINDLQKTMEYANSTIGINRDQHNIIANTSAQSEQLANSIANLSEKSREKKEKRENEYLKYLSQQEDGALNLALHYRMNKQYDMALNYYIQAGNENNLEAIQELLKYYEGSLYWNRTGVKNEKELYRWQQKFDAEFDSQIIDNLDKMKYDNDFENLNKYYYYVEAENLRFSWNEYWAEKGNLKAIFQQASDFKNSKNKEQLTVALQKSLSLIEIQLKANPDLYSQRPKEYPQSRQFTEGFPFYVMYHFSTYEMLGQLYDGSLFNDDVDCIKAKEWYTKAYKLCNQLGATVWEKKLKKEVAKNANCKIKF